MKLNDKIYNILKWGLIIFIPALITLIGTLGQIYNFETETIVLTISAISTFFGVITGISSANYYKGVVGDDIEDIDTNEKEVK